MNKVKLSPEEISRVREITSQRKFEIQQRYSIEDLEESKIRGWMNENDKNEQLMTHTMHSSSLMNIDVIENDRDFRRKKIIDRLEILL